MGARLLALASLAPWLATTAGCTSTDSFTRVDVTAETTPPLSMPVSGASIALVEGVGVAVTLTPYANGEVDRSLAVQVNDAPAFVMVTQGAGGVNEYFLAGLSPGAGFLVFGLPPAAQDAAGRTIDGTVRVPVTVSPQPPPSQL